VLPLAIALAAATPLSACFGRFALTQAIYDFNKDGLSDNFVLQELVFLGLVILQVYTIGAFIDAILLNPIEIFTGTNPIAGGPVTGESRVVDLGDGDTLTVTQGADGLHLQRTRGGVTEGFVLTNGRDGMVLTDGEGEVMATTRRLNDGGFEVLDGNGRLLARPGEAFLADLEDAWIRQGSAGLDGATAAWPRTCVAGI
jgi:hypothetical protein